MAEKASAGKELIAAPCLSELRLEAGFDLTLHFA
jgi:hypothetical protein